MKYFTLIMGLSVFAFKTGAQTLQSVTDNGNTTSNSILINPIYGSGSRLKTMGYGSGYFDLYNNYNNSISLTLKRSDGASVLEIDGHAMTSSFGGSVGIGTTAPEATLHVSNGSKTGAIRLGGSNGSNNGRVFIQADLTNDRSYIDVFGDDTYKKLLIDASTLVLNTVSNGNVGIGTMDTKGYKLAVAGNMIAESVKVQVQGSWSDFVFADDYKLPTLQETEKYIKEKGHLPGIPSAAEVKAKGIDVEEMNARLLQKIEELTLHLIELKKDNDQLKKMYKQQQQQINNLNHKN